MTPAASRRSCPRRMDGSRMLPVREAHLLHRVVDGPDDGGAGVVGVQGAGPGGGVLVLGEQTLSAPYTPWPSCPCPGRKASARPPQPTYWDRISCSSGVERACPSCLDGLQGADRPRCCGQTSAWGRPRPECSSVMRKFRAGGAGISGCGGSTWSRSTTTS